MQTISISADKIISNQPLTLRELVGHLVQSLKPTTEELNTFIINDIRTEVFLNTDQNLIASVIGGLLYNTLIHSWNNCIRIYEKVIGGLTFVYIRNNIKENEKLVLSNFYPVLSIVNDLGGSISIVDNMLNGTTVAFTFLNPAQAA